MHFPLQLNSPFRWTLYGCFGLMVATGAAWFFADWQKSASGEDVWQWMAAWLMMVHGGGAMATLLLLGALLPVHAIRAWRSRRNRRSGAFMLTRNGVRVATSFGLYSTALDVIRSWMSDIHIAAGFCLPVLFVLHVMLGRRTRSGLAPPKRQGRSLR
jgi:hypothetical protein